MKKIFFALAALVLAFTGCSQEEDAIQVSEKKAVKVVVNMDKPGFGEDTRAARTGWVDEDEVICTMGGPGIGIRLTYDADSDSWTTKILQVSGTNYAEVDFAETMESFLENPEDAEGYIHAAYFSSGIYSLAFEAPNPPTTFTPAMVITTNAYLASPKMGECVMTCENGTYKVEQTASEYVLTLGITMIPQVAQFTIKDLSAGENGKTSGGLEVGVAGGNLITYAGGIIMPEGIELNQVKAVGSYSACWVHPNTDGISIYASVDPETNEFGAEDTYFFYVGDDYTRRFNCNAYKGDIENGAAIKMDGPYTDDAASKWGITPAP